MNFAQSVYRLTADVGCAVNLAGLEFLGETLMTLREYQMKTESQQHQSF
jgi:hypothetical protein